MATVRIQVRRGTASQWTSANPTLAAGELGVESDTNLFKFGNGSTAWTALAYANNSDVAIGEISQDAINTALTMGAGLEKTYNDGANTITIAVDSTVATLTGTQTLTNKTLTSPALTGVPTAPTAEANTDTTQIATTAFAKAEADAAQAAAEATAAADATSKVAAEAALRVSGDAASVSTAAADATSKANAAQAAAISAAATDATTKANAAQTAAEATAAADATTKANAARSAAESYADAAVLVLTTAAPAALNTLNELAEALGDDANFAGTVTNSLATKAPLASPTFTGNVTLPSTTSVGDVSNVEIGYLNGVTSAVQTQLDAKSPLASPTFTGNVTLPESTEIGNVSNLEIGYLNGVTSGLQGQIDAKLASATAATTYAPLASPTLTGTVTLPESTSIGEVSNLEIGYLNGVTSAVQTQLDAKSPLASPTFTGTVTLPANTITQSMMSDDSVGTAEIIASSVTSSELAIDSVTTAKIADSAVTSAKIADLTIVNGDISSTAEIETSKISGLDTALGLKAPLASPTFTGTVSGITKTMVGLGSVDNTADTAKPVSTAQATAIATAKAEAIADATAQVNAVIASAPAALNTLDELAAALGDDANFATSVTTSLGLKAPLASPTFTGTVTVAAAGVAFTDGTQTKAGVPSLTTIGTEISAAYNLSTGGLALRDQLIPIAGARAITVPANSTTAYPVGTSIDWYQASGTGANFVPAAGVTILRTPGLTLRTTHSSATLTKVATDTWLLAGDLTA